MRKIPLLTALLASLALSACAGGAPPTPPPTPTSAADGSSSAKQQEVEITLWTFPVGNWGNPTAVASLLSGFHKAYPYIHVSPEYLTYDTGDAQIEQAVKDGALPDLIFEGPERLVANWGSRGLMADLSDLWESDAAGAVYDSVRKACRTADGSYYEFPLCMTAHCMAINYDLFREAGALRYIDEQTRTWTTEGFLNAVQALTEYGAETAGVIYCKNQSGDQGTRALVNNLYGGSFTDDAHTAYTIDSPENIRALRALYDLKGIRFEPSMSSADAISQFCRKESAMVFCWNVSLEIQQTINNPDLGFDIFPMAFPTDKGDSRLSGGIWGFGVFDNGDEARIEAAKCLIRYMTENDATYQKAVLTSTYWPVRDIGNIYENDSLMTEYSVFTPYMGDYYQVTPGWPEARAAWWKMLRQIGEGADAAESVKGFPAAE